MHCKAPRKGGVGWGRGVRGEGGGRFHTSCASVNDTSLRPGATFFDWTKDGVDEDEETPVQLQTDSDAFAAEMEAKGVGTDRPVVVRPP